MLLNNPATTKKVRMSVGLTSNNKLDSSRVKANAALSPASTVSRADRAVFAAAQVAAQVLGPIGLAVSKLYWPSRASIRWSANGRRPTIGKV